MSECEQLTQRDKEIALLNDDVQRWVLRNRSIASENTELRDLVKRTAMLRIDSLPQGALSTLILDCRNYIDLHSETEHNPTEHEPKGETQCQS